MMSSGDLISRMQFPQGMKSFRFQIDLNSESGGYGDQGSTDYRFRTKVASDTEISWRLVVKPSEKKIGLELADSVLPSAFAVFHLVLSKQNGHRVWYTEGARVFHVSQIQTDPNDRIDFIDADPNDGDQLAMDNVWVWNSAADSREDLSLHCSLDIPTDYGSEDFRPLVTTRGAPGTSTPYADNFFSTLKVLYEHIRSPICPLTDITLIVVDDIFNQPQRFYCHGLILATQSEVFARALIPTATSVPDPKLKRTTGYQGNTVYMYKIVGYDMTTVNAFLKYFYHGIVDVSVDPADSDGLSVAEGGNGIAIDVPRLIRLTKLAFEFGVHDLKNTCENHLINVCDVACYRVALVRLASDCDLRRLKSVLVALMATVPRHLDECRHTAIFQDLLEENARKMYMAVEKLAGSGGGGDHTYSDGGCGERSDFGGGNEAPGGFGGNEKGGFGGGDGDGGGGWGSSGGGEAGWGGGGGGKSGDQGGWGAGGGAVGGGGFGSGGFCLRKTKLFR